MLAQPLGRGSLEDPRGWGPGHPGWGGGRWLAGPGPRNPTLQSWAWGSLEAVLASLSPFTILWCSLVQEHYLVLEIELIRFLLGYPFPLFLISRKLTRNLHD